MGLLLFIVSIVMSIILVPIGIIFGFFKQFYKNSLSKAWSDINIKFRSMAVSIDKFGNVVCAELFNSTLIKHGENQKIEFGNHRQTISNVLGRNELNGTLTKVGSLLNDLLNLIDKDHSMKSIE